jgi:hypothetical protein
VEHHPTAARQLRHRRHVLQGADLVVDPHHGAHRNVLADERGERRGVDAARRVDGQQSLLAPLLRNLVQGPEHRLVLDRRRHGGSAARFAAPRAPDADEGHVVRLGAARGEHDLIRGRTKTSTHTLARLVERGARFAPPPVHARRVAEARPEEGLHRGEHLLADGGGGGVVEVDWLWHTIES